MGAGRPPLTVGKALGGSGQAFRPVIVLHPGGSEFCLKNNSVFHANQGLNGSPGCNLTLGGGQGRSARLKGWTVPCKSTVDTASGLKDAVETEYDTVKPQASLTVTEKNKA